jgi:hypothetical protein
MAHLRRPTRIFSFSDHQRLRPTDPPPGNELDGMLRDLREALISTQDALAELRRDDGQLKNAMVGPEQLKPSLINAIVGDVRKVTDRLQSEVANAITEQKISTNDVALLAQDAEAAAVSSAEFLSAIKSMEMRITDAHRRAQVSEVSVDSFATDAENWAMYAQAQAEHAMKSEDAALQWAEYLAGPVVSGPAAPAYIASSPWPHGLFYQPVEGIGVTGGLWSAKWWAIYCQMLVGWTSFFYLGAWDHAPTPGEVNPDTGKMVPNPLAPGSLYYDTVEKTLKVWTGDGWIAPFAFTGGYTSHFTYKATPGQVTFSGADMFGHTPNFSSDVGHDVHVNGVMLVRDDGTGKGDFTTDSTTDSMTLFSPVPEFSVVSWDLLVAASTLAPGGCTVWKMDDIIPDSVKTSFTLTYTGPQGQQSPSITKSSELIVVVDGIIQEPGIDFQATGDTLSIVPAVSAGAKIWAQWFAPIEGTGAGGGGVMIELSGATVAESVPVNTNVGVFAIANVTGSPIYTLEDSAGGKFKINGAILQVASPLDFETASSHVITVSVTGVTPDPPNRSFVILVQDVPEPAIYLSAQTISESAPVGSVVGALSVLNPYTGTPVFSMVDSAGGRFAISGKNLVTASGLDFETNASHIVTIAVTGILPAGGNATFTISVINVLEAILLSNNSIPENTALGTTVGTLSVTGVVGAPSFTMPGTSSGHFSLSGANVQVAAGLDFEVQPTHTITIGVTGVAPPINPTVFTINVTDVVQETPGDIVLTGSAVSELASIGTVVGTLSVVGVTGTPAFHLIDNAGGRFEIVGSTIKTLMTFDYETAQSHNITVDVSGVVPAPVPEVFTIAVLDVAEPSILLSPTQIQENAAVGTTVGTFFLLNSYTGTPVWSLFDSAGGAFSVSGNALQVAIPPDFETGPFKNIVASVSGIFPPAANKPFTIQIIDITEAILLSNATIAETAPIGTTVGTLAVTGVTGTPTFTLADSANGKFILVGTALQTAVNLDYETAISHTVKVHVTGVTPALVDTTFVINVSDVDESAGAIVLSNSSISEAAGVGAAVGTLSAINTIGSPTFSMVDSAGGKFAIQGSQVIVNSVLDYETSTSHNIIVSVVGVTPAVANQTFTIFVLDAVDLMPSTFVGGYLDNIQLVEDGVGIEPAAPGVAMAISPAFKNSGKWYFEVLLNDLSGFAERFGIAAEGASTALVTVSTGNFYIPMNAVMVSVLDNPLGAIFARGWGNTESPWPLGPVAQLDTICFAVDLDNWMFWAKRLSIGNWNGNASANPATNTLGIDIRYLAQTRVAPMGMFLANAFASTARATFNFGADPFLGALPAGFQGGWNNGINAATGHPTYAKLATTFAGGAIIEKGERLVARAALTNVDMSSVDISSFRNGGKYYMEFECIDKGNNSYDGVGVMTNDCTIVDITTSVQQKSGFVQYQTGQIYGNNAYSGLTLGTIPNGTFIGMAVDLNLEKIWFRVLPTSNWNGQASNLQDPATNTGGVSLSLFSAKTMGPFVGLSNASPQTIINTGTRPFLGAVPSGFQAGWPK